MRQIRTLITALLACLLLSSAAMASEGLQYKTVPNVLRPGKLYDISISSQETGSLSLILLDENSQPVYTVFSDYPLTAGENTLTWDGTQVNHSIVEQGEYYLRAQTQDGTSIDSALRIGAPYPMLTDILQNTYSIGEGGVDVLFSASEAGTLSVRLYSYVDGSNTPLAQLSLEAGENAFQWNGQMNEERMPAGEYALVMSLRAGNGTESMPHYVMIEVLPEASEETMLAGEEEGDVFVDVASSVGGTSGDSFVSIAAAEDLPEAPAIPEATQAPSISPPYSTIDDGTYWSMHPGELDHAVVWDILTQPITVYSDGKIGDKDHVYLMENPDGTGAKIAQIHGNSQGLHVIGETNEHGYVLVEAFSNYDPEYQPTNDEERAHAFDLKQGYIKASGLKTVEVQQDIAFVIDKLTQRMYMYMDGEPVTEFLIATGKIADNKYYNETIAGEFITVSHTGGFPSGNMYCDMAIRINGGILLHEVPYKENADGTKNYSSFEAYLGSKQSHGCVRIQRLKNPEGYNHRWLWDNLKRSGGYKVIIWDDMIQRYDSPTTWQPNPS